MPKWKWNNNQNDKGGKDGQNLLKNDVNSTNGDDSGPRILFKAHREKWSSSSLAGAAQWRDCGIESPDAYYDNRNKNFLQTQTNRPKSSIQQIHSFIHGVMWSGSKQFHIQSSSS